MSARPQIGLFDPMLFQSSYTNPNPIKPFTVNFWKKFHTLNFIFNIVVPIVVVIFVLFMLKSRYQAKLHRDLQKPFNEADVIESDLPEDNPWM